MPDIRKAKQKLKPKDYLIVYGLYALLIGLASLVAFVIWPPAIIAATVALTNSMWVHRGVYPFSMVLLGLGWFVLVLMAEGYLRNGMARQQVGVRFARLALPLALAAAFGLLLTYLAT